jgi:hypothetical protein
VPQRYDTYLEQHGAGWPPRWPAPATPRRSPRSPSHAPGARWLGEAEGLKVSLAGAEAKLAQMDQIAARRGQVVDLAVPTFADVASRTSSSAPMRQ